MFGLADSRAGRALTVLGGRKDLRAVSERMQRAWTSFAHEGEPAGFWPRYSVDTRMTRIFDVTDRVESDPRRERRLAWQAFRGYR